jgi:hypothetical protein
VEFENRSTVRLSESSHLTFDQLAPDEAGNKLNRLVFERGCATFDFLAACHDVYNVKVGNATLTPTGKSEFRTDAANGQGRSGSLTGSSPE